MQTKGTTRVLVLTGALTAGVYILAIRPWHLTWGSTREERRRAMLGFPTGPNGGFILVAFEPERSMLLEIREPDAHITVSVQLSGVNPRQTRLIGRLRLRFKPGLRSGLYFLLFEPGDFVMMRKMFLGIKTRAERFHGSVS